MNPIVTLRLPLVLLMLVLAGCAAPQRQPEPVVPPPVSVADEVWRQVDSEICAAAQAATGPAGDFAQGQMAHWRQLVTERGESDFIPWFSSYWTQQWLSAKVAWYNLSAGENGDPPIDRLAAYLQAQYHERVLAPAARTIDPATVVAQSTKLYVQRFATQIEPIPRRYGVPREQFERRLRDIPAIDLVAGEASAYQLVHAEPLERLPAYGALLQEIRDGGGIAGAGLSKTRISPVARNVSEKLLDKLAISGGASAASTLVGGVAGTVISIGAAGIGVMLHEAGRKEIETQLRATLNASLEDMWQILIEDRESGVMAGAYYLSEQIGNRCPPVAPEVLPSEAPPVQGSSHRDG